MIEMVSGEGERVPFSYPLHPTGSAEDGLTRVGKMTKRSVRPRADLVDHALLAYHDIIGTAGLGGRREPPGYGCMRVINGSQYFWTLALEDKIPPARPRAWSSTRRRPWRRSMISSTWCAAR